MPLPYHPPPGAIVICDYRGLIMPEMAKRRPSLVLSPRLRGRSQLCTVIPFSTTAPNPVMPYHHRLHLDPPLPHPHTSPSQWVKGDMIYTVSFKRLSLPFIKKDNNGKREYDVRVIDDADFIKIKECVLNALGMTNLTNYL